MSHTFLPPLLDGGLSLSGHNCQQQPKRTWVWEKAGKTAKVFQESKWMMASTTQIITGCLKYHLKGKQVGQASGSTWANYTLLRACWAHHTPSLSKHWPLVWWEKPSVPGYSLKGIQDSPSHHRSSQAPVSEDTQGLSRLELRDCVSDPWGLVRLAWLLLHESLGVWLLILRTGIRSVVGSRSSLGWSDRTLGLTCAWPLRSSCYLIVQIKAQFPFKLLSTS